jgi:hypothetical protein
VHTEGVKLASCLANEYEVFGFYPTKDYSKLVTDLMLKRRNHFYSYSVRKIRASRGWHVRTIIEHFVVYSGDKHHTSVFNVYQRCAVYLSYLTSKGARGVTSVP